MINFIKKDFNSVREAMSYISIFGREIPLGIIILYYIIMAPIGLLLYPIVKIWSILYLRKIRKGFKD